MLKLKKTGLLAVAACALASNAMAGAVFSGSAKCAWGNVTGAEDTVFSVVNSDAGGVASINWGVPGDGTTLDNQFTCNGLGSEGGGWSAGLGETFRIADFTYRNGSTFYGDLTGVDMLLGLSVGGASAYSGDFAYRMVTTNTPNVTGDPVLDGDIVSIYGSGLSSGAFSFDGTNYTVRLLGFSTDGGNTVTTAFNSPEGANVSAGIYAQIQVQSVPEPGTMALLASAGVALAFTRRRQLRGAGRCQSPGQRTG